MGGYVLLQTPICRRTSTLKKKAKFFIRECTHIVHATKSTYPPHCTQSVQRLIQPGIGSWPSVVGSSDVMRTLHTSARPVSRQGTVVFDPRVPATPRVPLRGVRYTPRSDYARPRPYAELDQALHTLGNYILLMQLVIPVLYLACTP